MRVLLENFFKKCYVRWLSQSALVRITIGIASLLAVAIILLWTVDKVFLAYISRSYVAEIATAFNLNPHLAEAIALGVFVLLAFFCTKTFSFSKANRRIGFLGLIGLLIAHSLLLWQGTRNQFFEASGNATKCYVLNREGVRYGEHAGIDPLTGKPCRPVTADMIERLQEYARGRRPERVTTDDPSFFDLKTGEPAIWFAKAASGEIELFDLVGFHPETGEELTPITREVAQEWRNNQRAKAERPPQKIDPDKFVFFDAKTGKARAWYWRGTDGLYVFYDNAGYEPRTGEALLPVSRDIVAGWTAQNTKKCFIVTRDTVRFGSKPGVDPETGRECRIFSVALLERLKEYEKGNRPKRVTTNEPVFFDLRTGEPNLWYAKNVAGQIELFDLMGFHPDTGQELLPITADTVAAYKTQIDVRTRRPPRRVDPENFAFFDGVTGAPKVWFWRGPDGSWEFYDNSGFRSTGEKLTLVTHESIESWRRETRKQQEEGVLRERQRLASIENGRHQEETEARRAAQDQESGDNCDLAAANPTDRRKPASVPGVEDADLKVTAVAAADVCTMATRKYPEEARYKYNLARALVSISPTKAADIFAQLTRERYAAAFDNYAGVLFLENKDLAGAIRLYDIGVAMNDPSAMVSVAWLISHNKYKPIPNPEETRHGLLQIAANAGSKTAQRVLSNEQDARQAQAYQQQAQAEQQRVMMNFFGNVLRGIAR